MKKTKQRPPTAAEKINAARRTVELRITRILADYERDTGLSVHGIRHPKDSGWGGFDGTHVLLLDEVPKPLPYEKAKPAAK